MLPAYSPLLRTNFPVRTCAAALLCLTGFSAGCASSPPPRKMTATPRTVPVATTPAPAPVIAPPPEPPAAPTAPIVQRFEIGRSVRGTPLVLEVFGDGPEHIFVFGGIHGNEPTSAALARHLRAYLRENPDAGAGCTIGILAEANPDGLATGTRDNAAGVDINRNFPARNWRTTRGTHGATANSEPETQAILRACDYLNPSRSLAIHSIGRGRHCNNYDGPAGAIAQRMARHNGYPARATMGYDTPGSFGSWAGVDRNIPTITLELPRNASEADCWRDNRDALLEFLRATTTAAE